MPLTRHGRKTPFDAFNRFIFKGSLKRTDRTPRVTTYQDRQGWLVTYVTIKRQRALK